MHSAASMIASISKHLSKQLKHVQYQLFPRLDVMDVGIITIILLHGFPTEKRDFTTDVISFLLNAISDMRWNVDVAEAAKPVCCPTHHGLPSIATVQKLSN